MSFFKTFTLQVSRPSTTTWSRGRSVNTPESELFIKTTWQPIPGKVLEIIVGGNRNKTGYYGFSEIPLLTEEQGNNGHGADIIIGPDEKNYKVVKVEQWSTMFKRQKFYAIRDIGA